MKRATALKTSMVALLAFMLMALGPASAATLTVTTDRTSYTPGATVTISGSAPANAWVSVEVKNPLDATIFLDTVQATAAGLYSTSFRLAPDAMTGDYSVYVTSAGETPASTTFTVTAAPAAAVALTVTIEVASFYFPGEEAVIYVLTDGGNGKPTNTTVTGSLILPDGTEATLAFAWVSEGLYKATYSVGATGTYLVRAEAALGQLRGSSIRSFQVSSTLVEWDAAIVEVKDGVATLSTAVGEVKTSLSDIGAKIEALDGDVATLSTAVGDVKVNLDDIGAKVTAIQGDVATIKTDLGTVTGKVASIDENVATIVTDLGTVKMDVSDVKGTVADVPSAVAGVTTAVWIAVVLSLIAAVAAIASVIQITRKIAG